MNSTVLYFFFRLLPPPPITTLFPYTTLFRSKPSPLSVRECPHGCYRPGFDGPTIAFRSRFTRLSTIAPMRSEEHTSELQSRPHLVCRLLLEKKNSSMVRTSTLISLANFFASS